METILIIDDTPANLGMLATFLKGQNFRVVVAQDGEEGLQRAELVGPDLILLDVMMPAMDGFETCRRLKANEKTREIPVIFMTALSDTANIVTGFQVGGVDYMSKPIRMEEALARIDTHLTLRKTLAQLAVERDRLADSNARLEREILERSKLEEQLKKQANFDALTGLPNRSLLVDRIAQIIAGAGRLQKRAVVAFLDLDHFKDINDSLGHAAGDTLLQEIAARLVNCVRESDTVARLGGDEFIIVLQDDCVDGVLLSIMQRIVERVAQPVSLAGKLRTVTCSIGISIYPQDGGDPATLMKNADIAMYRAKEVGRNSFQFFTRTMNATLDDDG